MFTNAILSAIIISFNIFQKLTIYACLRYNEVENSKKCIHDIKLISDFIILFCNITFNVQFKMFYRYILFICYAYCNIDYILTNKRKWKWKKYKW